MPIIKKFLIIILTLFIAQAAYASDINETVNVDISDVVTEEIIEIPEKNEITLFLDDINESDIITGDIIDKDSYCLENNNLEKLKFNEKSFDVETDKYNENYIENILNDTLSDDSEYNLNTTIPASYHIFTDFLIKYEVFIFMKLDATIKSMDLDRCIFKFNEFEEFDKITHDFLTFYNDYCNVLIHAVNENIIICSDKLNSKFTYCIDNSIVGRANSLSGHVLYHNLFKFSSLFFSKYNTSDYLLNKFYLNDCVYDFFSNFNNRMNEVYSFRI